MVKHSKVLSFKDSLQKTNKKLIMEGVPKTKDYKTVPLFAPLSTRCSLN